MKKWENYRKYFRHLRVLEGVRGLAGLVLVEAETPDGRILTAAVKSDEVEQTLKNWSPNEEIR